MIIPALAFAEMETAVLPRGRHLEFAINDRVRGSFMKHVAESDWKLFRSRIAGWQEAHMERLNREYIELLSAGGAASEKFWALDKRIREDRRCVGVACEMRRSVLHANIWRLLGEGVIGLKDLDGFSDELVESLKTNWYSCPGSDAPDDEIDSNI